MSSAGQPEWPTEMLVERGSGVVVYRVVKAPTAEEADWRSNYEQGAKPRKQEKTNACCHMALSMWTTREKALELQQLWPTMGGYLATVELDGDLGLWFYLDQHEIGHVDVWGRPGQIPARVRSIDPI